MNLAYGLLQGGAAAAASAVGGIDRQMKEDSDIRAADRKLKDAERLRAIEESFTIRAEERKRQMAIRQGQEIDTGTQGLLQSGDASRINESLGSSIDPNDPNSKETLAAIRSNPAARKAYGLPEVTPLEETQARIKASEKAGYPDAAKEARQHERNLLGDKAKEKSDEIANRRIDVMETAERNRAERSDKMTSITLGHQQRMESAQAARADAADKREARSATAASLKGVMDDLKSLEKEAADMSNMDPANQARIKKLIAGAREEAAGYRRALAGAGVAPVEAPAPEAEKPTPASDAKLLADPKLAPAYIKRFGQSEYDRVTKKATVEKPAAAPPEASAPPTTGLLASQYTPPPESPAGLLASRTAETRQAQQQKQQQLATDAQALAQTAIESRDPAAAQAAQDAPGFATLPQAIKAQIFALVRGR